MSFCPTKDIHSIYLDNEMPEIYKVEYESHLAECEQCRQELSKLKKLHELFKTDSGTITPDSVYLDQSFERLKIKQKYKTNVSKNQGKSLPMKYFIPVFAAAAAVLMALVIPVGRVDTKGEHLSPMIAGSSPSNLGMNTAATEVSLVNKKAKVISGNLAPIVLASDRSTIYTNDRFEKRFNQDMDFFRPEFNENNNMVFIKITVPGRGIDSIPITTEIELPMNKITGNFQ